MKFDATKDFFSNIINTYINKFGFYIDDEEVKKISIRKMYEDYYKKDITLNN